MAAPFWRSEREGEHLKEALLMQKQSKGDGNQNDPSSTHHPIYFTPTEKSVKKPTIQPHNSNHPMWVSPISPLYRSIFFFPLSSYSSPLSFHLSLSDVGIRESFCWFWCWRVRQWRPPFRQTRPQHSRLRPQRQLMVRFLLLLLNLLWLPFSLNLFDCVLLWLYSSTLYVFLQACCY